MDEYSVTTSQQSRICAIHQPNFFPWLGYFNKIVRSDVFILLDDAQYQKTGGTWTNRVQILKGDNVGWLTAPVDRSYSGTRKICEIDFSSRESAWRDKACRTIEQSYAKTKFHHSMLAKLEFLLRYETTSLAKYNVYAITHLCDWLGINPGKIRLASELDVEATGTERLISITHTVNAGVYLCGGGASGYQEDEKLLAAGLELQYQNFQHPVYEQRHNGVFIPGLSIIDSLMNCGFDGVRHILEINNNFV